MTVTCWRICRAIGGSSSEPLRLAQGVYEISHFSFDHEIGLRCTDFEDQYPDLTGFDGSRFGSYGVCDDYEQVVAACSELSDFVSTPYVLSVTKLRRDEQSAEGDWRWHKWGEYIGTQQPTREYLYDEPVIEQIYVYHIYKVPEYLEV